MGLERGCLIWGRSHKPIYAMGQALTLCAKLLRRKKASQKLGAELKSLAQSVNWFMKSTPSCLNTTKIFFVFL